MLFDYALDVLTGGANHLVLKKSSVFLFFWGFLQEKEKTWAIGYLAIRYWLWLFGYLAIWLAPTWLRRSSNGLYGVCGSTGVAAGRRRPGWHVAAALNPVPNAMAIRSWASICAVSILI